MELKTTFQLQLSVEKAFYTLKKILKVLELL